MGLKRDRDQDRGGSAAESPVHGGWFSAAQRQLRAQDSGTDQARRGFPSRRASPSGLPRGDETVGVSGLSREDGWRRELFNPSGGTP